MRTLLPASALLAGRPLLPSAVIVSLLMGCGTKWETVDLDGDGITAADGDCWEGEEGPVPGLSGSDIYPGAPDAWYDGVDADCAGNDDFDADGDGFVPEEYVGVDTLGIPGTGALHLGSDCWDAPDDVVREGAVDPDYLADHPEGAAFVVVAGPYGPGAQPFAQPLPSEVNPAAAVDALYDDVDQNCDGAQEFDQDGDGQDAAFQPRRDGSAGDDCVDGSELEDPRQNKAGLDPADIYAGHEGDVPYDGTDQDCSGVDANDDGVLDDCDQDLDGWSFVPSPGSSQDPYAGALSEAELQALCEYDPSAPDAFEDCDDLNPTAYPDPDRGETYYNYTDDNCRLGPGDYDGDADGDGHWDAGYDPDSADSTVNIEDAGGLFDDCWDNATVDFLVDALPVYVFNPGATDLLTPNELDVAWDADGGGVLATLGPADVYPGTYDRPYDRVDQDCAGDADDEFDWDGDGVPSLYQFVDNGDGTFDQQGDDCMDCADLCGAAEEGTELADVCALVCDNDAYTIPVASARLTNPGGLVSTAVNPGVSETWYDGTDQDCDRLSDYDRDGDRFGAEDYTSGSPFPWEVLEAGRPGYYDGAELRGGDDCNDTESAVNPGPSGQSREAWYDGVDFDCGGEDDYDADGDGYVPTVHVGKSTYQSEGTSATYRVTTSAAGDDCVDDPLVDPAAASYRPGATDAWYDGLDLDCADNDDFDADADGYRSEDYAAAATYHGPSVAIASGANPNTDCVDDPVADASDAGSYYPGATDPWYDGKDYNCADNDDFDQDADGDRSRSYAAQATVQGATTVIAAGADTNLDCVDTDTLYRGNGTVSDPWYDGRDYDCAGNDDYDRDGDGHRSDDYAAQATVQGSTTVVIASAAQNDDCVDDTAISDATSYYLGATDAWYDGKDYDCRGDDDYDADADGYRNDDYTARATVQGASTVVASSANPNTDCVDDLTVDVTAASYNPGAAEVWYDGDDWDCRGNDDYDADSDGYRTEDLAAAATYQSSTIVVALAANPNTDCVDDIIADAADAASYRPNATEVWYDGKDYNCNDSDDFDRDGDGDRSDDYAAQITIQGLTTVVAASARPNTDCVDNPSIADSTSYYGGAPDSWYDGKDYNCAGNDDYDADSDNYRSDAYAAAATVQGSTTVVAVGARANTDCVDSDSTYNPGATDAWYDGFDKNCADNDDYDADGDNQRSDAYAAAPTYQASTIVVASGARANTDCVDSDATYGLSFTDAWYDGLDKNCADNDDYDADGDGQRSDSYAAAPTYQGSTIVVASGARANTDCVDSDATYGLSFTDAWYDGFDKDCGDNDDYDADRDGDRSDDYSAAATRQGSTIIIAAGADTNTDCVDTDNTYYVGATDAWYDGFDKNCAGNDDYDADGDNFRSSAYAAAATLQGSTTVVASGANPNTDCVDSSNLYYPGASDAWYDGQDRNCLGNDDYDVDNDNFRSNAYAAAATVQGSTTVVASGARPNTDCVDNTAVTADASSYYPGATDAWYDGQDRDCGGNDDYDRDADNDRSDAYAAAATVQGSTTIVAAGARPNLDCIDTDPTYSSLVSDAWYDGVDRNCGDNDDYDADGDSYRSSAYSAAATLQGSTTVVAAGANPNTDCVDSSNLYYPGASDAWYDGQDRDCAGDDDYDVDGDLFRSDDYAAAATVQGSTTVVAIGANPNTDCVDNTAVTADAGSYYPAASDSWYDGKDYDCAGDDDYDRDVDNYRTSSYANAATVQGSTVVVPLALRTADDCDDALSAINPGATEVHYNSTDEDCDPTNENDADGDGEDAYAEGGADCDDADPAVQGTLYYEDADSDTYGDPASFIEECTLPVGYVLNDDDCDDDDPAQYLGATEVLNGEDDDCDGDRDEGGLITADSEHLLITEIMIDPSLADHQKEWFELHNPNSFDVVLDSDWALRDNNNVDHTFPTTLDQVVVPAGDYVVFARNATPANNGSIPQVDDVYTFGGTGTVGAYLFHNTNTDFVSLRYTDPVGGATVEVDRVGYDFTATTGTWLALKAEGYTVQLDISPAGGGACEAASSGVHPAGYPTEGNDALACWCNPGGGDRWGTGLDRGTPGSANVNCP